MLDKEICLKCVSGKHSFHRAWEIHGVYEDDWSEGVSFPCVQAESSNQAHGKFFFGFWYSLEGPPRDCPYSLEHIVQSEGINA